MIILISFVVAFVLVVVPMPGWVTPYRPDWIAMVLIYWALAVPHRVGSGVGWMVGLMEDVVHANVLGVHALGMALLGYITNRFHLRLRMFPWWQQALAVLVLLLLYRAVVGWLRALLQPMQLDLEYWLPCLAGMVAWPWLFVILRDLRRSTRMR